MGRLMRLLGFADAAALGRYLESFTQQRQRPPRHLELALQEAMEEVAAPAEREKAVASHPVAVPADDDPDGLARMDASQLRCFAEKTRPSRGRGRQPLAARMTPHGAGWVDPEDPTLWWTYRGG